MEKLLIKYRKKIDDIYKKRPELMVIRDFTTDSERLLIYHELCVDLIRKINEQYENY